MPSVTTASSSAGGASLEGAPIATVRPTLPVEPTPTIGGYQGTTTGAFKRPADVGGLGSTPQREQARLRESKVTSEEKGSSGLSTVVEALIKATSTSVRFAVILYLCDNPNP